MLKILQEILKENTSREIAEYNPGTVSKYFLFVCQDKFDATLKEILKIV